MSETALPATRESAFHLHRWLEMGIIPDWLIRAGIRQLLRSRLKEQREGGAAAQSERFNRFLGQLRASPIALYPDSANEQHYEVPAEFFELVLGPHRKYSCALWEEGIATLEDAESAMLDLTCQRARLEDGQDILELGCGWGSLSLYIARRYPRSRILAVSNSHSQKQFIDREAQRHSIANLEVITADMNHFATGREFDRVLSIEMFEHMRNFGELLRRISGWLRPDGLLFVHIFSHRSFAYPYEVRGSGDWMARHFFSGGIMPSDDLLFHFQDHLSIRDHWTIDGVHYHKTTEAWLRNLDKWRGQILDLFRRDLSEGDASRTLVRWRIFFMACSELFGYRNGREWLVSHYLFDNVGERDPASRRTLPHGSVW